MSRYANSLRADLERERKLGKVDRAGLAPLPARIARELFAVPPDARRVPLADPDRAYASIVQALGARVAESLRAAAAPARSGAAPPPDFARLAYTPAYQRAAGRRAAELFLLAGTETAEERRTLRRAADRAMEPPSDYVGGAGAPAPAPRTPPEVVAATREALSAFEAGTAPDNPDLMADDAYGVAWARARAIGIVADPEGPTEGELASVAAEALELVRVLSEAARRRRAGDSFVFEATAAREWILSAVEGGAAFGRVSAFRLDRLEGVRPSARSAAHSTLAQVERRLRPPLGEPLSWRVAEAALCAAMRPFLTLAEVPERCDSDEIPDPVRGLIDVVRAAADGATLAGGAAADSNPAKALRAAAAARARGGGPRVDRDETGLFLRLGEAIARRPRAEERAFRTLCLCGTILPDGGGHRAVGAPGGGVALRPSPAHVGAFRDRLARRLDSAGVPGPLAAASALRAAEWEAERTSRRRVDRPFRHVDAESAWRRLALLEALPAAASAVFRGLGDVAEGLRRDCERLEDELLRTPPPEAAASKAEPPPTTGLDREADDLEREADRLEAQLARARRDRGTCAHCGLHVSGRPYDPCGGHVGRCGTCRELGRATCGACGAAMA